MQWVWKAGYEIVAIGNEKLIWWKVNSQLWELWMKSLRRVKVKLWQLGMKNLWRVNVKLWQLGMKNLWRVNVKLWQLGMMKNLWRVKVKLWQMGVFYLHSTQEFGSFWGFARQKLPLWCRVWAECGCIIYVIDKFPSLGIKGRAIMLYFITIFILLVTEFACNIFLVACIMYSVICNILLFASIMYFYRSNKNYIFPRCTLFNLEMSSMKLGHSSINCHP